jgi:hypothetical protein
VRNSVAVVHRSCKRDVFCPGSPALRRGRWRGDRCAWQDICSICCASEASQGRSFTDDDATQPACCRGDMRACALLVASTLHSRLCGLHQLCRRVQRLRANPRLLMLLAGVHDISCRRRLGRAVERFQARRVLHAWPSHNACKI